jgi:hypothetical protein
VHGFHGSNGAVSQGLVLRGVGNGAGTGVAIGVHPELRVRVDVHVELDALARSNAVELGFQGFRLDAIAGRGALVVFGARGGASAAALVPVVGPVAVDVAADAAGGGGGLTVLAPHAVGGLRVGEAVGVDDREDVEVVLVFEAGSCSVGSGEELVCCVLDDPAELVSPRSSVAFKANLHGGDPFSRVDSSVPHNTLLRSLSTATPDVDSLDVTTLSRRAR